MSRLGVRVNGRSPIHKIDRENQDEHHARDDEHGRAIVAREVERRQHHDHEIRDDERDTDGGTGPGLPPGKCATADPTHVGMSAATNVTPAAARRRLPWRNVSSNASAMTDSVSAPRMTPKASRPRPRKKRTLRLIAATSAATKPTRTTAPERPSGSMVAM
jgi:hypothetical protein